jgi:hypothetical protein
VRVAIGREIRGYTGEDAGIDARIDDVAFVIHEQQLAGESAREAPDRRLFGEPSEEPRGGPFEDVRIVSVGCQGVVSWRVGNAMDVPRRRRVHEAVPPGSTQMRSDDAPTFRHVPHVAVGRSTRALHPTSR